MRKIALMSTSPLLAADDDSPKVPVIAFLLLGSIKKNYQMRKYEYVRAKIYCDYASKGWVKNSNQMQIDKLNFESLLSYRAICINLLEWQLSLAIQLACQLSDLFFIVRKKPP